MARTTDLLDTVEIEPVIAAKIETGTGSIVSAAPAAAAAITTRRAKMGRRHREVMRAVTRVGAEAGVVILIADTHVVLEETEISTEVVAVAVPALALQIAIAPEMIVDLATTAAIAVEMTAAVDTALLGKLRPRR